MKTIIILALLAALAGVAYFTRPSERSMRIALRRDLLASNTDGVALTRADGDTYARQFKYVDHYLWVTAEKDGKTQYVGVFSHWFPAGVERPIRATSVASQEPSGWYGAIGVGS